MNIARAYAADITKFERNADGDLVVYGKATGPDLDLDQQICDSQWLKTAMPDYMVMGGAVREQHSSIAAGVATELAQDGDSWMLRSVIVDPNSARKVEKGVLKGYSIGIKNPRVVKDAAAPGGKIVSGSIVEVSLVDVPCNPTCTLVVSKTATPGMQIKAADYDEKTGLVRVEELLEGEAADLSKGADAEAETGPAEPVDQPVSEPTGEAGDPNAEQDAAASEQTASVTPEGSELNISSPAEVMRTVGSDIPAHLSAGIPVDLDDRITRAVEAALAKRAFTADQRREAADNGQAMSDGGFPIANASDLRNAIKAIGRAKDPAAAKRHIIQRAKALRREDLLPDAWKSTDPDLIKADGPWVHDPAELAAVRDGLINVMKAELDEFAQGDDERCDLQQLLCSLSMYLDWWSHEAAVGETSAPFTDRATATTGDDMVQVALAAEPDNTKTTSPTPALDEERVNQLITAAVTKTEEASKERIAALEAELVKVKSKPIPGGPVLTRTAADTTRAAIKDDHLAKATRFRAMADQVADPKAKAGYLQMAADATKAAESDGA
jgi:hypothetical protein